MNMTRAILEGIHEVELQVTPEFQKSKKLSVYHVHDLLKSLGWEQEVTDVVVTTESGVMAQRVWTHPDLFGMRIVALRRTDESGGVTGADPDVAEIYAWRADWGVQKIVPNLKDVEDTAKFLVASSGLEKLGAMGGKASLERELDRALEAVGWKVTASSGTGVVVYEHPGVRETIEVTVDKDDNIIYAEVVFQNESLKIIDPPTVENIVARAEALKSWANL